MATLVAERLSRSPRETARWGEALGRLLQPGDFVGLIGDLGAGKTQLVRGIARGLGVPDAQVSSPSFAIVAQYVGRTPLYHADLYRLSGEDELYATGYFELGVDGPMVVEWLDRIPRAAPPELLRVRLAADPARGADVRVITADAHGERSDILLREWLVVLDDLASRRDGEPESR